MIKPPLLLNDTKIFAIELLEKFTIESYIKHTPIIFSHNRNNFFFDKEN